jgi:predicted dehydrogenase
MPLRVGLLTAAHLHVWSYVGCLRRHPDAEIVGVWEEDPALVARFAADAEIPVVDDLDRLLESCDSVAIVSENVRHAELAIRAARAGCHVLCEKPLATTEADGLAMIAAAEEANVRLMTAFPCRFSPAWARVKARVARGDIGDIKAICATNRGRCPFGWFVEPAKSGGGAMIDHVVHVADLLRDLLGVDPIRVQAQTGHRMYGEAWEDTAMLTLAYEDGLFASLDSSWSRPQGYYTWGDVTMNLVGSKGVIELDMFGPHVHATQGTRVFAGGYGSDPDAAMVHEFVSACLEGRTPAVTGLDGLRAARIALAGYQSAATNSAVDLSPL